MKIGIHAPSKPAVVVSLLLAILALIGYFVDSSFAFFIAMFAYIVGALGVLVEVWGIAAIAQAAVKKLQRIG